MRWADHGCAVAALCIAGAALAAPADQSTYGKVDTFEPGKKYNCVPSADRKSWDCTQTGTATSADAAPTSPRNEPTPAAPAKPRPATPTVPPAPPPVSAVPHTGTLPSYLLAPGAGDPAAPASVSTPAAAASPAPAAPPEPATAPIVHSSTNLQPTQAVPAPPPAPEPAAAAVKSPAAPPVAAPAPTPASMPARPRAPANDSNTGSSDFLALDGDQYVIELAHAKHEADIAAIRAVLPLAHGKVYELHLRQNGGDAWLLVWGSFDDVGAARAARSELPADARAGWPRRIAPLQTEVRRAQE